MTNITIWDLYENAARTKYGQNIQVLKTQSFTKQLCGLQFDVSIVSADPQPVEIQRAAVDISTKEYANHDRKEADKTVIKVESAADSAWDRSRYHFSTTRGASCGIGSDIGPQVMRLAITGSTTKIKMTGKNEESESITQNFRFKYEKE